MFLIIMEEIEAVIARKGIKNILHIVQRKLFAENGNPVKKMMISEQICRLFRIDTNIVIKMRDDETAEEIENKVINLLKELEPLSLEYSVHKIIEMH